MLALKKKCKNLPVQQYIHHMSLYLFLPHSFIPPTLSFTVIYHLSQMLTAISAVLKSLRHLAVVTAMSGLTCPLSQPLDWVCQHADI